MVAQFLKNALFALPEVREDQARQAQQAQAIKSNQQSIDANDFAFESAQGQQQQQQMQAIGKIVGRRNPQEIARDFNSIVSTMEQAGLPIDDDDRIPTAENIGVMANAAQFALGPQKQVKPSAFEGKLIAEGLEPGTEAFQARAKEINSKAGTNINLGGIGTQEKASDKKIGEFDAEVFTGIVSDGREAFSSQNTLRRAKQLSKQVSNQGALGGTILGAKKLAKQLGVDLEALGIDDDTAAAEAFSSVSLQFALDTIQQTKGAVSNAEMELFLAAAPGLANTAEGNQLIFELLDKVNKLKIGASKAVRDYRKRNGGKVGPEIQNVLAQFHAENPLFTEELQSKVDSVSQQSQPNKPQQSGNSNKDLVIDLEGNVLN